MQPGNSGASARSAGCGDGRHQLPVEGNPSPGWGSHRLQWRVHLVEPADLCDRAGAVPGQGVQQRGLLGVQRLSGHHAALRVGFEEERAASLEGFVPEELGEPTRKSHTDVIKSVIICSPTSRKVCGN